MLQASILKRSSPPLRQLSFIYNSDDEPNSPVARAEACITLVPTVIHLELQGLTLQGAEQFFALLEQSPPDRLLPNLQVLTLRDMPSPFPTDSSWNTLARGLSARRGTQLRSVSIIMTPFPPVNSPELSPNTLDLLRALVEGGMEIYIGTRSRNLLSPS
ncbi:hypothetical protein FB45DRAFT_886101 [Roridomyces roridus]|uniref:Uncharacterized protein n=1 Tax=Roridomyces roridus TaxID=1738132 RepID=A0AAD7G1I8_9AGAR|nr:hypothetical protein FB45DRAFT_886101 [Roridomyces roridus]